MQTTLEEAKQKADAIGLELEKTKRTAHEQSFTISDLRIKLSEVDNLRADSAALSSKLVALKADFHSREKDLTLQVETLRHQKATVERELTATREKISIHRNGFEQSHVDLARLRAELDSVIVERDRLKRDLVDNENMAAEQHLFDLKRDLEQTVHEFNDLEKEKSMKDKVIEKITAECSKEREKVTLLKLQMSTLEDRLRVANQELSVYRGIDVYHSSMQVQLQSYRKDRSFNDSVLEQSVNQSVNQSRYAPSQSRTAERDLGSAFANSLNLDSTTPKVASRPSSRVSNAGSVARSVNYEDSERDSPSGRSSRSHSPVQFNSRISSSIQRVDLTKPSSPIIRPAPIPTPTAADRHREHASASRTYPSSAQAASRHADASNTGRFSLQDMEPQDQSQDELEVKSVVSDLASHHSHYSRSSRNDIDYVRREEEQYLPAPSSNARSSSAPRGGRAPQPVSHEYKSDPQPPLPPGPAPSAVAENERQELLRRRAERKALRDQQLRDRILREGTLGASFSSRRGEGAHEVQDDVSVGSAGSAPRPSAAAARSASRSHSREPAASSAARERENLSMSLGSRRTVTNPVLQANSRVNPIRANQGSANLSSTAGASASRSAPTPVPAPGPSLRDVAAYRPAKTDFERARKLLSM